MNKLFQELSYLLSQASDWLNLAVKNNFLLFDWQNFKNLAVQLLNNQRHHTQIRSHYNKLYLYLNV